ncbi:MAG TPA: hypothetical protein PLQ56_04005 [Aggregatilineales bacterium]|nr:hypothetical protein [Aggregatilineales bacterium]
MKRITYLVLSLWLLIGLPVLAQEDTASPQTDYYTGLASTEETLIYRLPVGADYLVTISGERLMTRTFLKFNITNLDGSPLAVDTPVSLRLRFEEWASGASNLSLSNPLVNQDGIYLVEPFSLPGEGSLQGTLSVGSGAARSSNDFQVQVFPRRPAMPPWFAPVNLAIPFIVLALILAFVISRKVTLFRLPEAVRSS